MRRLQVARVAARRKNGNKRIQGATGSWRLVPMALTVLALGVLVGMPRAKDAPSVNARATVAALDREYQAAVKKNDARTIAHILADNSGLVTGSGKTYTKADMIRDAYGETKYQHNDEESQEVRVWGDTAVVTAKLWEAYTVNGKSTDHKLCGSATSTSGRRMAGNTYLDNHRCHCPANPAERPLCKGFSDCPRVKRPGGSGRNCGMLQNFRAIHSMPNCHPCDRYSLLPMPAGWTISRMAGLG